MPEFIFKRAALERTLKKNAVEASNFTDIGQYHSLITVLKVLIYCRFN